MSLYDLLECMCDHNDHDTVLQALQVLGKSHRAGYLTTGEFVKCLIYCGNRFAEQGNGDFFEEYVQYMPDINRIHNTGQFTPLCKSYYFAYKHAENTLNSLQTECLLIDIKELINWFRHFIVSKKINDCYQLRPLIESARAHRNIRNDDFKQLCEGYTVPIIMKTGRSILN